MEKELNEEFNPSEIKQRYNTYTKKILDRLKRRNISIQSAKKRGDELAVEIQTLRIQIDQLELKRVGLRDKILSIKIKRMKK